MYIVKSILNSINQNPEQLAFDIIDKQLADFGRCIQNKKSSQVKSSTFVAAREPQIDFGLGEYVLVVGGKKVN